MSLAALGGPALLEALAACSSDTPGVTKPGGSSASPVFKIASPSTPVTWPVDEAALIADALEPEKGATLKLYNYADYIGPGVVKAFEKKYAAYDVKVRVSTFNDTDEALTKIRAGKSGFDIYFPSYDQIAKMVTAKLIRPLNHSYIPNIANVWPEFTNPWYDGEWHYTVPYTSTRPASAGGPTRSRRHRAMPNPYDVLLGPELGRRLAVIDDWHTAMAMVALRAASPTSTRTKPSDLAKIQARCWTCSRRPPQGHHHDVQRPAGRPAEPVPDVVRRRRERAVLPAQGRVHRRAGLLVPADGKGMVDNDLMVILSQGQNPVLAHLFVNFMLDTKNALKNFGYIGYQPPQTSLTPEQTVSDGYVPANLTTAVVRKEWFGAGYRLLGAAPRGRRGVAPGLATVQGRRLTMSVDAGTTRKGRRSLLWPALALPGALWLALLFLAPLYVVLSIVFGGIDPIFRTPLPVWNPAKWNSAQFLDVFDHIFGSDGYFGPALLRTAAYVCSPAACACWSPTRWPTTPPGCRAGTARCCSRCSSRRSGSAT
jgi:spermidine/putrescine transport system substrate-binding protein